METRMERWEEYRNQIKIDESYLTETQRDLIAMYLLEQSVIKLPEDFDEAYKLIRSRFKVAREIVNDMETREDAK